MLNLLIAFNCILLLSFAVAFFKKIYNAGNIVGTIFFSLTFLALILRKQIYLFFISSEINSVTLAVICSFLFMIILPLFTFSFVMTINILVYSFAPSKKLNFSYKSKSTKYKFIIVPGCKVKGNKPSKMLMQRINAAYKEYLKEPENTFIIASGGKGNDEAISEAECIYNELLTLGVDNKRIYKEEKSTSTYENMRNSYQTAIEALHSKKLYGRPYDNYYIDVYYVVATNDFHMYRSIKLAEKVGFKAYSKTAHTTFYLIPTYWIRELLALFKFYFVRK